MAHPEEPRDQSIPEAMRSIVEETRTLARQEMQLAKAEFVQKGEIVKEQLRQSAASARHEIESMKDEFRSAGKKAGMGAGLVGSAGVMGMIALALFGVALTALLALVMPVWIAAALAAFIYVGIAGVLLLSGRKKMREAATVSPKHAGGRLKALATASISNIRERVSFVPERTVEAAKESRERVQEAWERGGREEEPAPESESGSSPSNGSRTAPAPAIPAPAIRSADPGLGLPFGKRAVGRGTTT